jgi:uncharacterized protein YyaL (SSP411 family)
MLPIRMTAHKCAPSRLALLAALLASLAISPPGARAEAIRWETWSDAAFARAEREKRFVILDLEAVWCHWCHVMEESTYADPEVQKLIAEKYIAIRVDQDARPDLSNRYEDYGWPATVVFAADGSEIVKRRGYIPPGEMIAMLKAIIADPSPGPSVEPPRDIAFSRDATLPPKLRAELEETLAERYDAAEGGWGRGHKYLDWDNVEWSMRRALAGDAEAEKRARQTIAGQRNLLDPVWGGMYQYSTDGDWVHPHFEKIMSVQAENMRIAALAYAQWQDPADLATARAIQRYAGTFLTSPEGAFFTSQDADLIPGEHSGEYFTLDDAGRQALGVPLVDTHIYTRENAWLITGLAALHAATGDAPALAQAQRATEWIIANRAAREGGFRHGEKEEAIYLGDQIYLVRAFLALHSATADQVWLDRAEQLAEFIRPRFVARKTPGAGFTTEEAAPTSIAPGYVQVDENIAVARVANELFQRTAREEWRTMAARAMRYVVTREVLEDRNAMVGGVLLAGDELRRGPLHGTVLGRRDDAAAIALYRAALADPATYKRLDWFDPAGAKPAHLDIVFPPVKTASAFVCGERSCSSPVTEPAALARLLRRESAH